MLTQEEAQKSRYPIILCHPLTVRQVDALRQNGLFMMGQFWDITFMELAHLPAACQSAIPIFRKYFEKEFSAHNQISAHPPGEFSRLRQQFVANMQKDYIEAPDYKTRLAILKPYIRDLLNTSRQYQAAIFNPQA